MEKRLQKACDKTAEDIQADATQRAPVDTGFLRDSIYAGTSEGSDYGAGGMARPHLPEVHRPPGISAVVAVSATYAAYLEYGTHRMAAQPYFTPAVERAREPFKSAAREAVTP
jgi:HK97 gp10 family phage protein